MLLFQMDAFMYLVIIEMHQLIQENLDVYQLEKLKEKLLLDGGQRIKLELFNWRM